VPHWAHAVPGRLRFGDQITAPPRNPFAVSDDQVASVSVQEIFTAFGEPSHRASLANEYAPYRARMAQLAAIPLRQDYAGPVGQYVDWGRFASSAWDKPLGTGALFSCSALVLIDPIRQRHWMAHVFPGTRTTEIAQAIQEFAGDAAGDLQAIAIPGLLEDVRSSLNPIESALEAAFRDRPTAPPLTYAAFDPAQDVPGVLIWQGELYAFSPAHAVPPWTKRIQDYNGYRARLLKLDQIV
jgi:hypothetical protein